MELALRNYVAHACDDEKEKPERFISDFKVSYDSYNSTKFLEVFVTNCYPKLLVGLYNCYKGSDYATKFYPK